MHFARQPARAPMDVDAFIRRHQGEVWHYLRVCGCDHQTAFDLVQETFLVVLRKGVAFDDDRRARSYLRRTARLLFLEAWRREATRPFEASEAWLDVVDRRWHDADESLWLDALRRCRERLHGRRREAVELFYEQQLSRAEVARRLGMTENGVKTALQRVRADLRACVEERLR